MCLGSNPIPSTLTVLIRIDGLERPSMKLRCIGYGAMSLFIDSNNQQPINQSNNQSNKQSNIQSIKQSNNQSILQTSNNNHYIESIQLNIGNFLIPISSSFIPSNILLTEQLINTLPSINNAFINIRIITSFKELNIQTNTLIKTPSHINNHNIINFSNDLCTDIPTDTHIESNNQINNQLNKQINKQLNNKNINKQTNRIETLNQLKHIINKLNIKGIFPVDGTEGTVASLFLRSIHNNNNNNNNNINTNANINHTNNNTINNAIKTIEYSKEGRKYKQGNQLLMNNNELLILNNILYNYYINLYKISNIKILLNNKYMYYYNYNYSLSVSVDQLYNMSVRKLNGTNEIGKILQSFIIYKIYIEYINNNSNNSNNNSNNNEINNEKSEEKINNNIKKLNQKLNNKLNKNLNKNNSNKNNKLYNLSKIIDLKSNEFCPNYLDKPINLSEHTDMSLQSCLIIRIIPLDVYIIEDSDELNNNSNSNDIKISLFRNSKYSLYTIFPLLIKSPFQYIPGTLPIYATEYNQTDIQTDIQTDNQTYNQTDNQTDTQTHTQQSNQQIDTHNNHTNINNQKDKYDSNIRTDTQSNTRINDTEKHEFVNSGTHILPLFMGKPSNDILQSNDPYQLFLYELSHNNNITINNNNNNNYINNHWNCMNSNHSIINTQISNINNNSYSLSNGSSIIIRIMNNRIIELNNLHMNSNQIIPETYITDEIFEIINNNKNNINYNNINTKKLKNKFHYHSLSHENDISFEKKLPKRILANTFNEKINQLCKDD